MGDSLFLQQIAPQAPLLVVYLLGMVLAVVFWTRCPGAAIVTVLGCGVLVVTTLVMAFVQASMIERQRSGAMTGEQFAAAMRAVGFVGSAGRALGLGVIVAAVFMGRARAPQQPT
jgi:hypothetical protein